MGDPVLRSRFVDFEFGQIRVVVAGEGDPIVLIHHTPRSWTYYKVMMPILARSRKVIAFDTPGFGDSDPLPSPASIPDYARATIDMLDALGVGQVDLCGAMTGACTAVELALNHSQRIRRLALLAMPMFRDDSERLEHLTKLESQRSGIAREDGGHILAYWEMALQNWRWDVGDLSPQGFELASQFTSDAVRAGGRWAEAAHAAYSHGSADTLKRLKTPTIVIGPEADFPYTYLKMGNKVHELIEGSRFESVHGTPITITTTHAVELSDLFLDFFAGAF
ncbi:MAG: alpha/beta hydrolase [Acidimicrobiales bacterium]